jgi:hypothetical protein
VSPSELLASPGELTGGGEAVRSHTAARVARQQQLTRRRHAAHGGAVHVHVAVTLQRLRGAPPFKPSVVGQYPVSCVLSRPFTFDVMQVI